MPYRRLDDKIRALADRAVAAGESDEIKNTVEELRSALHDHSQRLRKLAAEKLAPSANRPRRRDYDQ